MPTPPTLARTIATILFGAALLAEAPAAHSQDIQITGPLAGASAVRRMRIYREGRIQLEPNVGFTLQDEFSRAILVGLQANYHLTDWLGIGVWGAYDVFAIDTNLTDQIGARGQATDLNRLSLPSAEGFTDQIGRINYIAMLQGTFIPLRGKLALFQKVFVDTDFTVFAGLGVVGVEERADVLVTDTGASVCDTASTECLDAQSARVSRAAFSPTFGAGLAMYVNNYVAVTFEWRALPFAWNTSGTDQASSADNFPDNQIDANDHILLFNHLVKFGAAFYLPTVAKITE